MVRNVNKILKQGHVERWPCMKRHGGEKVTFISNRPSLYIEKYQVHNDAPVRNFYHLRLYFFFRMSSSHLWLFATLIKSANHCSEVWESATTVTSSFCTISSILGSKEI